MAEETKREAAQSYPVDRLLAESGDRLGVDAHVLAGALAAKGGNKQHYTVDEAKAAIDKWLKQPIEVDNPIGSNYEEEKEA